MNRRDTLGLFLALAAASPRGFGQPQPAGRIRRVGILLGGSAESSAANRAALAGALADRGWKEGGNLTLDARFADGRATDLPRLAAELAQSKPDVVVCQGPGAALAFKGAGTAIPAVFVVVANPVGLGLAQSLGRPGGNFTGLATLNPELFFAKQLELLHEIAPRATRLATLFHPDNPIHTRSRETSIAAIEKQGLKSFGIGVRTREELAPAFADAARHKPELLYVSGDALFMAERAAIAGLALRYRLPSMFLFHEHVESGGLMSYGIDITGQFRQAAAYVDRILKGSPPRDLPIEEPAKYVMAINLKTARALGISIPQTVLLRADRVIE